MLMKDDALLTILEETAEKLSIELDYEELRKGEVESYGDAFVLRGQRHIIIDKRLDTGERGDLLVEILAKFDTSEVHLAPEVRDRLDSARATQAEKAAKEAAEEAVSITADEEEAKPKTEEQSTPTPVQES